MKVKRGIVIAYLSVGLVVAVVELASCLLHLNSLNNRVVAGGGDFVAFTSLQISTATSFLSAVQWTLG